MEEEERDYKSTLERRPGLSNTGTCAYACTINMYSHAYMYMYVHLQ